MLKSSGFFRFKDLGFRVPVGVYWLIRGPVQRGSIKREREREREREKERERDR